MIHFYLAIEEEDRQLKKQIDLHTRGRHYATVNYMRMCRYEGAFFRMYDDCVDVCLVPVDSIECDRVYRLDRMYICESPAGYWIVVVHPEFGVIAIGLDPDVPDEHVQEMRQYPYVQYRLLNDLLDQLQAQIDTCDEVQPEVQP